MPEIRLAAEKQKFDPVALRLRHSRSDTYSQAGEDGIIAAILKIMGTKNKWCAEFGAWDGVHLSNTCRLIREEGWNAVLIEGQEKRYNKIRENHPDKTKVFIQNRWVGFTRGQDTIEDMLKDTPIPKDFDLISIDIDGLDWHIWESMVEYRPRLVVIEFNPTIPNSVVFIQDRDFSIREGNSFAALVELGKSKGYELVAANALNGFFVPEEEFAQFGIKDNSISAIRQDTYKHIWCGYNGKIYNTLGKLLWQNKLVGHDELQLVDTFNFET